MINSVDELNEKEDEKKKKKKWEIIKILEKIMKMHEIKNIYIFLNIYKMFKINVKTYQNNCIHTITVQTKFIKQSYR